MVDVFLFLNLIEYFLFSLIFEKLAFSKMENVLMEFLDACVHQILYHRRLYPPVIFVKRLWVN